MGITAGSDMRITVKQNESEPLVFMPQVDWGTFTEPTILDAY